MGFGLRLRGREPKKFNAEAGGRRRGRKEREKERINAETAENAEFAEQRRNHGGMQRLRRG